VTAEKKIAHTMKIRKKIILLVGLGILLVPAATVFVPRDSTMTIKLLFFALMSVAFLLLFNWYLRRNVSAPLSELLKGVEEISRGKLDYQVPVRGTGEFELLAERFNELARRIDQSSSAELERKLFDRTRKLAALDAVALTLSRAGNLEEILDTSLTGIFDSLASLEPRGGIFLCEPGGEKLRLTAQQGLAPEFAQREATVRMGECLCGKVAQTGEMLLSEQGCNDPYHTREKDAGPHAHVIVPLKSRGVVLGVMFLYPRSDGALKPSDLQLLEMIGAQLGLAIENFRFYTEVKEASQRFSDLFENSRDVLFTVDNEGRLTSVNKAAELFTGYSRAELIGKNVLDFLTHESAQTAIRLLSGITPPRILEFDVVKRDGSRAVVDVSARRLLKDRVAAGYQVSVRDMTEQKELQEMLVKAERLGAIGQVGIAMRHEINNPLTTIIGNVELLLERSREKDAETAERLEVVLNNALRIAEIIKRLEELKQDKVVEYLKGVKMTDLKSE
jgi:PAS domain S-box-containing protein